MGTAFTGEVVSSKFNIPVDCDKNNGFYWFDVKLSQNKIEIPSSYYFVGCEDYTIYITPAGDGV